MTAPQQNMIQRIMASRMMSWLLMIVMLVGFGYAIHSFFRIQELEKDNRIKAEENEALAQENQDAGFNWKRLYLESLEKEKERDSLIHELEVLAETNSTPEQVPIYADIQKKIHEVKVEESQYFEVMLFGFGESIEKYWKPVVGVLDQDFRLLDSEMLTEKTDWLAQRNTIFYYSNQSDGNPNDLSAARVQQKKYTVNPGRDKAIQLQEKLKKETGLIFFVQEGAGTGVPELKRGYSLRVHLIGKTRGK